MSQTCVAEKRNGSVTTGANDIVDRLNKQSASCPNQKFALVGYSQGASVARAASVRIDPIIYPKILALVMFGDPGLRSDRTNTRAPAFPVALQSKLRENCASGDQVRASSIPQYVHRSVQQRPLTPFRRSANQARRSKLARLRQEVHT
jgi:hypothetical protein